LARHHDRRGDSAGRRHHLASPIIGWFIGEYVRRWQIEHYTYRLDAARILAGTLFPAGSEVKLSIDAAHGLDRGSVPVPTKILGLEVVGAFTIGRTREWRAYVKSGTLASETTIKTVPCAPGPLERDEYDDEVRCALSPATCRSPAWC
jgi:hypothetical protein